MKKNSFKSFVLLFSVLLFLSYEILKACFYDGFDDKYNSNFTPEIAYIDDSYTPLFLSQGIFYGIGHDVNYISRFNDAILKEWTTYLSGAINNSDLSFFLLDTMSEKNIEELYQSVSEGNSNSQLNMKVNLSDNKVKSFISFMHFAKNIERVATQPIDPWSYEPATNSYVKEQTINQIEKAYNETQDIFLKNRYWFQVVKAKFYSSNKSNVIDYFERTHSKIPENKLYYRALSYVAGAYYKQKNYAKSNYLYSIVFNKCNEMRTVATYNFHPQEQADFNASLGMATSNDEKAALWTLFGYYADEKQAINEIYKIDRKNKNLELLLTRLINKEEIRLNSKEFKDALTYKTKIKTEINKEAFNLINRIAKEEKTTKPYLWNIAAGYLNILSGNTLIANQLLEKASLQSTNTQLLQNQIRILRLINNLFGTERMDYNAENKLLPELNWLYNICPKNAETELRYENALTWSKLYIASLYKNEGNKILNEVFQRDDNFYKQQNNLQEMKAFLSNPKKSPWEQFALDLYEVSLSDINEYQAIVNTYDSKIDQAIAFMEKSKYSSDTLQGNPFNSKIKDCHDCDFAQPQKIKYTKLSFLLKIKEMQTKMVSKMDLYNNFLLTGNALYNISYFGNARIFYYNNIMNQNGNYIEKYYQPILLNCSMAKSYYEKAFNATSIPEQKAKCLYLIAKCERNEFYYQNYFSKDDSEGEHPVDFLAWNGFKKLKKEYSNTQYYKEVINECGYFKKYLKLNK